MGKMIDTVPGDDRGFLPARVATLYPGASRAYRMLETDWPVAIELLRRLACYLGVTMEIDGQYLLDICIANGLRRYEENWSPRDRERLRAVDAGMLECLSRYLDVEAAHPDCEPWRLSDGRPLLLWRRDNRVDEGAVSYSRVAESKPCDPLVAINRIGQFLYPVRVRALLAE